MIQTENSIEKKEKILGLVIVDGVGYRNFILSDFVNKSLSRFDRVIIFSGLPADSYDLEQEKLKIVELLVFTESGRTWFWRKMKEVAHMQLHKKKFRGIAYNLEKNRPTTRSRRAFITHWIFRFTAVFHSESWISSFYKRQLGTFKNNPEVRSYEELIRNNPCDILFFTHQRPPYLAPMVYVAKKLQLRTSSFIFSWDNLASKGRMAADFDSYVVWSDLMKQELSYFYPDTIPAEIKVAGTPQFEPYILKRYDCGRTEFYEKFNLDPDLKTVCYSCGDVSTSKNDALYIRTIAEFISQNQLSEKVNLLVRTSPAEDGSRFRTLTTEFPFIKWNYPKWQLMRKDHPEPWSQRVPLKEDMTDLKAVLKYCDLGINMCSTMSLDFMLFDKPVINPVFGNGKNELYNDSKYLEYSHYRRVVESGAVVVARNSEELLQEINFSLSAPEARIMAQRKLLELQIGKPLEGTSSRIAETLKNLI